MTPNTLNTIIDTTSNLMYMLIGAAMGLWLLFLINGPATPGVYAHSTGEAAYLRGEACVINDLPEIDFQAMGAWCNAQRAGP